MSFSLSITLPPPTSPMAAMNQSGHRCSHRNTATVMRYPRKTSSPLLHRWFAIASSSRASRSHHRTVTTLAWTTATIFYNSCASTGLRRASIAPPSRLHRFTMCEPIFVIHRTTVPTASNHRLCCVLTPLHVVPLPASAIAVPLIVTTIYFSPHFHAVVAPARRRTQSRICTRVKSSQIYNSSKKTKHHHPITVRVVGSAFAVIANHLRLSDQSSLQRSSTMEETHMGNPNFGRETNLGETALTHGNLSLNNQRVNNGQLWARAVNNCSIGYFTLYLAGGTSIESSGGRSSPTRQFLEIPKNNKLKGIKYQSCSYQFSILIRINLIDA